MSPGWVGFLVGAFMGGTLGVLIMGALCAGVRRTTYRPEPLSPGPQVYAGRDYLLFIEPGCPMYTVPLRSDFEYPPSTGSVS